MQNYQLIVVKYYGATNNKGARVKLIDNRFNLFVFIPFDYSLNTIGQMAINWLKEKGYSIKGEAEMINGQTAILVKHGQNFKAIK